MRLEGVVKRMNDDLVSEQKRGRELLKAQKEQQRLLAAGGNRDDQVHKLAEFREDLRVAKERLRRGTEANEIEARNVAEAERRCGDLAASLKPLEQDYTKHVKQVKDVKRKEDAAEAAKEAKAQTEEAKVERAVGIVAAERAAQLEVRVRAKAQAKALKAEVARIIEELKKREDAKKRVELKRKAEYEKQRQLEREAREREREEEKAREKAELAARQKQERQETSKNLLELAKQPNPKPPQSMSPQQQQEQQQHVPQESKQPQGRPRMLGEGSGRNVRSDFGGGEADARATAALLTANAAPAVAHGGLSKPALGAIPSSGSAQPHQAPIMSAASLASGGNVSEKDAALAALEFTKTTIADPPAYQGGGGGLGQPGPRGGALPRGHAAPSLPAVPVGDYDDLDDSDFEEVVDDIEESRQKVLRRMELETKSPGKKSNASYDDDFEDDFED